MKSLLTNLQGVGLARLFYGLPERNYHGKPMPGNKRIHSILVERGYIQYNRISERGIRELRRYCGMQP